MTLNISTRTVSASTQKNYYHFAIYAVNTLCLQLEQTEIKPGVLTRFEEEIPASSLLTWLEINKGNIKNYWSNRSKSFSLAGIGSACTLSANNSSETPSLFDQMKTCINGTNATFFGGLTFNNNSLGGNWEHHPYAEFVLPQIELACHDGRYTLAVNLLAGPETSIHDLRQKLIKDLTALDFNLAPLNTDFSGYTLRSKTYTPNRKQWNISVLAALDAIHAKRLEKVVMSRQTELVMSAPISEIELLNKWRMVDDNGYLFCLKSNRGAFIGNSPECLYTKERGALYTEALAGTVPRGAGTDEELSYENALLNDPKTRREHRVVYDYILKQLKGFAQISEVSSPLSIVKLTEIQHLSASFNAQLNKHATDAEIIKSLHPTPAVCGTPLNQAMDFINDQSSHARGWYSGLVGTVSEHKSEFCVAIRSVLIKQNILNCYAGVGLVEGSEAQAEWDELDSKIKTVMSLFNI